MPSRQLFANNAQGTLAAGINNSATSVTLNTGEGARFGTSPGANEFIRATLRDSAGTTIELVNITSIAGDALTIVRAQEGTTAQAFSAGATISVRWTKGGADRMTQRDADEAVTGAWTFPAPSAAGHPATRAYVDGRAATLSLETLIDNADSIPFYDLSATTDRRIALPNAALALSLARQTGFLLSSTVATSLVNGVYTRVQLNENWDAGDNVPGANYYVAPATGYYFFFGAVSMSITNAIVTTVAAAIELATSGGVSIGQTNLDLSIVPAATSTPAPGGAISMSVTAGQRVYLSGFQNNGGPRNTSTGGACYFGGWRIA